ncbi:MAG TPA: fluoride efflux transporter CrcB [Balneolales bacterium]|nr:fluoride efflux transporter CrcB [Balneolales bacterium]
MKFIILVGVGGFFGSVARYLLSQLVQGNFLSSFPYGTMTVNILGCFIIGVIYALSTKGIVSPEYRVLLATGFCGGFTTFSSFSYESMTLLQDGQFLYASMYAGFSFFIGLLASYAGVISAKIL